MAAPREPITLPLVTSSLCPHLGDSDRIPFRHGLFLALALLIAVSMLRLLPAVVVLAALGIPLLFVLYLWRSGIYREVPLRALVVAPLIGIALSVTWWLWTGSRIANSYGIPLAGGFQLKEVLDLGLAVTITDPLLMMVPAVVVRLLRLPSCESLDGFLIGALGALCYTSAGTVTWLAPQFVMGLLDNYSSQRLLSEGLLYGVFDPLTAAAAGGMAGLLLWFRPARRPGEPGRLRWALAACTALGIGYYIAIYAVAAANNSRLVEALINTAITALALLTLRVAMQIAVLHEAPGPTTGREIRCARCAHSGADMPFCSRCGGAARASARSTQRLRSGGAVLLTLALTLALVAADLQPWPPPAGSIGGPYARILAAAADLGPARATHIQLTAALDRPLKPARLQAWSASRGLSVRWQTGERWAVVEGPPAQLAAAFGVEVNDYRLHRGPDAGRVFYASPQQPAVPADVRGEVTGLGRILGYLPHRLAIPPTPPLDVPDGGLLPSQLLTAYNAAGLAAAGHTGRGSTVVVFAFDGYDQEDMDMFSDLFDLPRFSPEVVGGMPAQRSGEATMDLQVIHAVAPDAKLVLVNARSTFEEGGGFEKVAQLMRDTDRRFPGAIWSLSIGWGCEQVFTAADLAPVRSATAAALRNGTTAFIATGDLAGLECKGGHTWSDPPSPDDVGVDAVAAIPEMTAVGGTRLSTDAEGRWLAEQSWYDVPLTQGSAGGASKLFGRPQWQTVDAGAGPPDARLVPDVSAVGDPFTGVKHVFNREIRVGGGTSQSAPIWAGLAAIMNDKFASSGAPPLGELNPLLYQVAKSSTLPSFRDVRYGGNAVTPSGLDGYDTVTGLGTPNVENLVRAVLLARSGAR